MSSHFYPEAKTALDKTMAEFHSHLEICVRCQLEPFNLCPEGSKILTGFFSDAKIITEPKPGYFDHIFSKYQDCEPVYTEDVPKGVNRYSPRALYKYERP